ncbi:integrase core domain-containing protein [Xanthomonas axonopodis]|uniref:integrase core domain-containing protein n=1 Tax=Xanthomonas axonopodis TaxID=53413 RepID=UPI003559168A
MKNFFDDSELAHFWLCFTRIPANPRMVERVIRTLKEQCAHRHRFESQTHALRVIGDWIGFYNHERPHQALKMMTPDAAYAATLTA